MEVYPSNWPSEYICPISRSVMADPVIVSSGQTYERRCIEAWMELGESFCVEKGTPLMRGVIIPNESLKAAITNMGKSKGLRSLPSPPSPDYAYALARRLIQERHQSNSRGQEAMHPEPEPEDASVYYEETDVQSGPIRVEYFQNEEESEEGGQEDDLYDGMESLSIDDGSPSSYGGSSCPPYKRAEAPANAPQRKGIHLKSSSSLPPLNTTMEDIDVKRGPFAKGPSRMRPANAYHQANYARVAANLEQGFDQFREHSKGASGGGYSVTDPMRNLRPTAGRAFRETPFGSDELPPHLLTRPSAYSSPESTQSFASPPSMVDTLVQRLRAKEEEEQEEAIAELRRLSRAQENRTSLCRPDIIESFLPLLRSKKPSVQVDAVASLVNLSIEKPNKVKIVRAGAVRFLVEVLSNGCHEAQEHAAGAAFSLAIADENKHPMGILNVVPPLVQILHTGPNGARQDAAMALYHLSLLQANKSKLVKVGAVPILFNLAQSRERPDLASRALVILSNVASIPEGRAALLQVNAIPVLVKLLAIQGGRSAAPIPEQAAAVLVLLATNNLRFRSVAQNAGAQELLSVLVENGTIRAREKALALLALMKESSSVPDELDADSVISRQYMRMRVDAGQMNSSAF
ncbi:hypothetical protein GOP47_0023125 [Adiantum capillus-veneris]|uniref:RING-type E3 ubiquitin transferase n=1 Tax=Adiantum capillus-veneris TaxID=13818 RepID=A0A9D4U6S2_ADICA|nr:hypothetical protein GOP47_0023125 [Adiantum capillus-veneris]